MLKFFFSIQNTAIGNKTIWLSSKIFVDQADAAVFSEGEVVTFVNWGNIIIRKINRYVHKISIELFGCLHYLQAEKTFQFMQNTADGI